MKKTHKLFALLLCLLMTLSASISSASNATFMPGTYTGVGKGRNGELTVSVTVNDNEITAIDVISHNETAGICEAAIEKIPAEILRYQSLGVDICTGATLTSTALLEAISNALAQTGADVDARKARPIEIVKGEDHEYTTQVCIIGGGTAGLVAALSLAEADIDVIVLEKTPSLGGEGIKNGGLTFAIGTDVQRELGLPDEYNTPIDLWKYWLTMNPDADEEMFMKIFSNSNEMISWLTDDVGVRWDPELRAQGNDWVARNLTTADGKGGVGFMKPIIEKLKSLDSCQIITEARANHLLTDEKGDVIGATAEAADGSAITVHSDYVIMATGHYDNSKKWMERFHPEIVNYVDPKLDTWTGDGLDMAEEININLKTNGYFGGHVYATGGLYLNDLGNRFTNEAGYYGDICSDLKANNGGNLVVYQIATQKNLDEKNDLITYVADGSAKTWAALFEDGFDEDHRYGGLNNAGHTIVADTLEELCEKADLPLENVQATISRYNELCAKGADSDFGKDAKYLASLEEGPYYLYKFGLIFSQLEGGIEINHDFQPLRADGSIVGGMYAVGCVTSGEYFRPNAYSGSGTNMSWAFGGGRLVALDILGRLTAK